MSSKGAWLERYQGFKHAFKHTDSGVCVFRFEIIAKTGYDYNHRAVTFYQVRELVTDTGLYITHDQIFSSVESAAEYIFIDCFTSAGKES